MKAGNRPDHDIALSLRLGRGGLSVSTKVVNEAEWHEETCRVEPSGWQKWNGRGDEEDNNSKRYCQPYIWNEDEASFSPSSFDLFKGNHNLN